MCGNKEIIKFVVYIVIFKLFVSGVVFKMCFFNKLVVNW